MRIRVRCTTHEAEVLFLEGGVRQLDENGRDTDGVAWSVTIDQANLYCDYNEANWDHLTAKEIAAGHRFTMILLTDDGERLTEVNL
jgi:hypothetical protein